MAETLFDAAAPAKETYTSAQMRVMLRERHPTNEWALMFEVGNSTGFGQRRWADAVAVHLWPSKGNAVHGMEIKVSRSDWAREIANPLKAEEIEQYCDFWWLVAPKGVVRLEELPTGWGLMEASGGHLRAVVKPVQRREIAPLTRGFVAAMLRRASGADEAEIAELVRKKVEPEKARLKEEIEREVSRRTAKSDAVLSKVAKIEEIVGLPLDDWRMDGAAAGHAIRFVMDLGPERTYGLASSLRQDAERLIRAVDEFGKPSSEAAA